MTVTVTNVDELTPQLLSNLLGAQVVAAGSTPLGVGNMSGCYRLALTYAEGSEGPASLVAKMASGDAAVREANALSYRAEVGFYSQLASRIRCAAPRSYYAGIDDQDNSFLLLLEDLSPAEPGDQIRGCSREEAGAALTNLAGLHASTWCDPQLRNLPFLAPMGPEVAESARDVLVAMTPGFIERFSIGRADAEILNRYGEAMARCIGSRTERYALLHNDYRLDNLMFDSRGSSARPVVAVDWAVIASGLPGRDVAFFLATGLEPELRRAHERDLVAGYCQALNRDRRLLSVQEAFDDYVYGMFQPVLVTVIGAILSQRSERGDRMFKLMIERSCAAIRDLDAAHVLP